MAELELQDRSATGAGEGDSGARPRVLHVLPSLSLGGAVRVVLDLIGGIAEQGRYEQRLCVLNDSGNFFGEYELPPTEFLDFSGAWRNPLELRRVSGRVCRLIEEFRPDVLHTHLWTADVIGASAASRTGTCHLVHVHDTRPWLASNRWRHRLRKQWTRRRLRRSQARLLACSEAVKAYTCRWLGIPDDHVTVVYYGTDVRRFDAQTATREFSNRGTPIVVGTAGRFDWEKGHEQLLQAAALLTARGVQLRVRIAGDGKLRSRYEEVIRELGLEDRVELVGAVRDMPRFYQDLDVFVLPSLAAEGLPLTILESLALATPIVATRVAGAPEVIRDGIDGILVAPGNVDQLAAAIGRLAAEPALREAVGTSARQRILARHTLSHMVDGVARAYGRLLSPVTA